MAKLSKKRRKQQIRAQKKAQNKALEKARKKLQRKSKNPSKRIVMNNIRRFNAARRPKGTPYIKTSPDGSQAFVDQYQIGMEIPGYEDLTPEKMEELSDPDFIIKDEKRVKDNLIQLLRKNCRKIDSQISFKITYVESILAGLSYEEFWDMVNDPVFQDHFVESHYYETYNEAESELELLIEVIEQYKK